MQKRPSTSAIPTGHEPSAPWSLAGAPRTHADEGKRRRSGDRRAVAREGSPISGSSSDFSRVRDEMREPGGRAGRHDDDERDDDPEPGSRSSRLARASGAGAGARGRGARRRGRGRGHRLRGRRGRRHARRRRRSVLVVLERGEVPRGDAHRKRGPRPLVLGLLTDGDLVDPRPDVDERAGDRGGLERPGDGRRVDRLRAARRARPCRP